MAPMLNVGLTGGIASGKTTIAGMFVELGARVIDLDAIAHREYAPGGELWGKLVARFSPEILNPDQTINRERLGARVFNDAGEREALNRIVHPRVLTVWLREIETHKKENPRTIVISEVPLLFETGLERFFDVVILAFIPSEEQSARLRLRNGISEQEAKIRLSAQLPIEEKVARADLVIDNRGTREETEKRVGKVWKELVRRERECFKKQEGLQGEREDEG